MIFIGSGHSCWHGALLLKLANKKVTMVERELLGGTCTNYGCDAKILLDSPIELKEALDRYQGIGLPAPAKLDWTELMQYKKGLIGAMPQALEGMLAPFGIDILHGAGSFVDAHTIEVETPLQRQTLRNRHRPGLHSPRHPRKGALPHLARLPLHRHRLHPCGRGAQGQRGGPRPGAPGHRVLRPRHQGRRAPAHHTYAFDKKDHLVGAAVIGDDADSYINVLTLIINKKITGRELGQMVFAFPTPTYGLISTLIPFMLKQE